MMPGAYVFASMGGV